MATVRRTIQYGCWLAVTLSFCITGVVAFSTPQLFALRPITSKLDLFSKQQELVGDVSRSDCDDSNTPPSLSVLLTSLKNLKSGSDIRGTYVEHATVGSLTAVVEAICEAPQGAAALTPFAAHCLGYAFGTMVNGNRICVGQDPRSHGARLADAFCRGAEQVPGIRVTYTGLATTPAMLEFCRADMCDGAVMVTASHLPKDRNGLKYFTQKGGGFTKQDVQILVQRASEYAQRLFESSQNIMPPTSGNGSVFCSAWVDYMPHYAQTLKDALVREVTNNSDMDPETKEHALQRPLEGLKIVLNSGNGAGYFFNQVLEDMGADVSRSLGVVPDSNFPNGVPNPENSDMVAATMKACEEYNADIGIMLDTDADRCGFVVPRTIATDGSVSDFEALNRNRLIALLSVIFSSSSPGCTVVTDSVTSEGLAKFLTENLKLNHVRYLKGYANVIGKAKELTSSSSTNAELAIETSGHCAMKENSYLDDGTYTAVKVIGLLARERQRSTTASLLDLIADLEEMPEENELRMTITDGSLETTGTVFDQFANLLKEAALSEDQWDLDLENLEGVRVRTKSMNGGFFMLRKSLHDPLISLQIEGTGAQAIRDAVISPILSLLQDKPDIIISLELDVLNKY